MKTLAALLLMSLAACGVDGRPVAPGSEKQRPAAVQISGAVEVGVAGTP
ncbi:hypothetical protein [Brevirhabdus sp.]